MGQHSAEIHEQDCATCGVQFSYKISKNRRHRIFCSRPCIRYGVKHGRPPRVFKVTTACEVCGGAIPKKTHNHRWCLTCVPDKSARARIQRYGVSQPDWDRMAAQHDGMCWICKEKPATCVDHSHTTGRVRGVLCDGCNHALFVIELPGWQKLARDYLAQGG